METKTQPIPAEKLSQEATRLINEIWDHLELTKKQEVTHEELQTAIEITPPPTGDLTSEEVEFQLRKKLLMIRDSYRKSEAKADKTKTKSERSNRPNS